MTKHTYPKQLLTEKLMVKCGYNINHPTLAQLEGLLRNEYGYHCVILPQTTGKYMRFVLKNGSRRFQELTNDTYEQSLEILIIKTFKLILKWKR